MYRKLLLSLIALGAFGLGSATLSAQEPSPNADNTKVNRRDRAQSEPTADQAKNNLSDRERMQKIRKSLMEDKSLSSYPHNVKVISQNGRVTLKGPVRSEEERKSVEEKATEVAGPGYVTNQLTIKAARSKDHKDQ
jgi:osmotically-inducible protein OsmY